MCFDMGRPDSAVVFRLLCRGLNYNQDLSMVYIFLLDHVGCHN